MGLLTILKKERSELGDYLVAFSAKVLLQAGSVNSGIVAIGVCFCISLRAFVLFSSLMIQIKQKEKEIRILIVRTAASFVQYST